MVTKPIPQKGRLLHSFEMPVRWGDMDALGHVNNIMYLRYFEQSRILWSDSIGFTLDNKSEGMILLKSTVTYLQPLTHPADLIVRLYAGQVGRTSFTIYNDLWVKGVGEVDTEKVLAAEAEFVIVWFDYRVQKPAAVPQSLRRVLEQAE